MDEASVPLGARGAGLSFGGSGPILGAKDIWRAMMHRVNDVVLLLGRLLMAGLFLPSGIGKLMGFSGFAASLAAKGMPYPEAWAAAAVAIEIVGPIALILGFLPR